MNGCFHRGEIYHILPEDNTTKPKKALPTHVSIEAARFRSIALCEQVHTVAKKRVGDYIDKLSKYEVEDVDAAIVISLGLENALATARK